MNDHSGRFFLGLPAWGFPGWSPNYFTDSPSRLGSYAKVFNTVEGNTTFYRIPEDKTVTRWKESVAGREFQFCFKLPREVTHNRFPDYQALKAFLDVIQPLRQNLAPLLVQFPASVGPDELEQLDSIFQTIRESASFVIEVRHSAFFEAPELLDPVLEKYGAGRVSLDSRPLYQGDRSHPEVTAALHVKPDLPVIPKAFNNVALIRLILHPDISSNAQYIREWADHVAGFLNDGNTVFMMIHCPNNLHCPDLARWFHETLSKKVTLPDLSPWPTPMQQASLF